MQYIKRQKLINKYFEQAEKQKLKIVQQNLNDPFEIYYYPTPIDDVGLLQKLEEKVKKKLVQVANLQKLGEVEEELKRELYIVEEEIMVVKLGNEELDDLIKMYESRIKVNNIRKDVGMIEKNCKEKVSSGCQTNQVKRKQAETSYQDVFNEIKLKKTKTKLYSTPTYSMTIQTQLPQQTQAIPLIISQKPTQSRQKPRPKLNIPEISTAQPLTKTIPSATYPRSGQLYSQIQKQIKYLQHLKKQKNKHRPQYRDQKNKVKFLMEMFWKNVDAGSEDRDITLPILREEQIL